MCECVCGILCVCVGAAGIVTGSSGVGNGWSAGMASIQGGGSALSSHSSNNAPLSRPHIYQSRASLSLSFPPFLSLPLSVSAFLSVCHIHSAHGEMRCDSIMSPRPPNQTPRSNLNEHQRRCQSWCQRKDITPRMFITALNDS